MCICVSPEATFLCSRGLLRLLFTFCSLSLLLSLVLALSPSLSYIRATLPIHLSRGSSLLHTSPICSTIYLSLSLNLLISLALSISDYLSRMFACSCACGRQPSRCSIQKCSRCILCFKYVHVPHAPQTAPRRFSLFNLPALPLKHSFGSLFLSLSFCLALAIVLWFTVTIFHSPRLCLSLLLSYSFTLFLSYFFLLCYSLNSLLYLQAIASGSGLDVQSCGDDCTGHVSERVVNLQTFSSLGLYLNVFPCFVSTELTFLISVFCFSSPCASL